MGRLPAQVVLQAVSTVKELADVAPDVVLKDKATTWVLINELGDVDD